MVQRLVSSAYQAPSSTVCQQYGSSMQCTTTPGQNYPATYSTEDVNYQSRKDAALECLKALGWSRQPIKQTEK
jgi:hypothetical protein